MNRHSPSNSNNHTVDTEVDYFYLSVPDSPFPISRGAKAIKSWWRWGWMIYFVWMYFLVATSITHILYVVCSAKALSNSNYGPNFELLHATILAKKVWVGGIYLGFTLGHLSRKNTCSASTERSWPNLQFGSKISLITLLITSLEVKMSPIWKGSEISMHLINK